MITTQKKKVVLVVTDGKDYSIKEISEWLLFYSSQQKIELVVLDVSQNKLEIKGGTISTSSDLVFGISNKSTKFKLSQLIGILFRQAPLFIEGHIGVSSNRGKNIDIKARVYNYFMAYEATIKGFVTDLFSEKNIIGYDSGSVINKLEVLKVAGEVGLNIPPTLLTSNKNELLKFHKKHNSTITKSLAVGLTMFDFEQKLHFYQLTHLINENDFNKIPEHFGLTLIQQTIDKEFEIRVFCLDETCYSWALFSQTNEKTFVDYRNYDLENPMRIVSYQLPTEIENQINQLMKRLQLRTGSIDLMYSKTGEYFFLEVNPAGQYAHNAVVTNTLIDKKIAESLIFRNESTKHRKSHS